MKKLLKIFGRILGILLLLILIGYIYINASGIPKYKVESFKYVVESSPESLERGEKLAMMLCAGCHTNSEKGNLSGTWMLDAPKEFGKIYAPNITQDKEHGIGNWTDGEIVYLLRTGIKADGKYAPPYMAKLPSMADEDMNAIISFLRSDHKLVAPDSQADEKGKPSFLTKFLCRVAFKPLDLPNQYIEMPDTTNSVEWGKYLTTNFECFSCHSADFKTNDVLTPALSKGYFGGGNKTLNREGKVVVSSNLTPDEKGIGNWSEDQFIRTLKYGQKEGEASLQYPMQPYLYLSDAEASAIWQYLQTVPPIDNEIKRVVY